MNLLPPNATKELRAVDKTLEFRLVKLKDINLDLNPLTCKEEILPHLALIYTLDISNLDVSEQRQYIHNAFELRRHQGSLWSTRKALELIFSEAVITEWFEDATLEPYHFRADLTLSTDLTKIYDQAKFKKSSNLLNLAKNERSVFDGFELKIPSARGDTNLTGGGLINVNMQNNLEFNYGLTDIKIAGGAIWTV